ncbi:MAG: SIMPL domain-containing protein [Alphaproteobacteria bacterium]|nr:SIMPL domain-containing protein [Alphaproteobacteria bacterium]
MKVSEKFKNMPTIWVVILAFGFALAGFFIGNGVYKSLARRTVTVKGLAEMDVVADTAVWSIKFNRVGSDLARVQSAIDEDINKTHKFLTDNGFKDSELQNLRVQVRDKFAGYSDAQRKDEEANDRYVIETGVMVRSNSVELVDAVSRKMGDLVRQGVTVTEDYAGPIYIFNGLNDIKIKMIETATKNATAAGEQFAKDANAKLGKIQSANQGLFSISARDQVDAWSDNEKQAINKRVRVVTTITFYLR